MEWWEAGMSVENRWDRVAGNRGEDETEKMGRQEAGCDLKQKG
jgi:hypothetical protein